MGGAEANGGAEAKRRAPYWRQVEIERAKASIKADLDLQPGPEARLKRASAKITELADDLEPKVQLHRLIYIVSALVHHERHGGLTDVQIKRLGDLGTTILRVLRVRAKRRVAAALYGDLHAALSQVWRKHGRHWEATWQQHLAQVLGHPRTDGFALLVSANRQLRLGDAPYAIEQFRKAEAQGLDPVRLARARFDCVRALRLMGDLAGAEAVASATTELPDLPVAILQELEWEALCRAAQSTGEMRPLLNAVQAKGSHCHAGYIVEAALWCWTSPQRTWARVAPKLSSLARRPGLNPRRLGAFYDIACTLEEAYDNAVPFTSRLVHLGKALARTSELVTVDKELLVWAAAYRWLLRSKAEGPAQTALLEYQSLSSRLTAGRSLDALGVGHALVQPQNRRLYLEAG